MRNKILLVIIGLFVLFFISGYLVGSESKYKDENILRNVLKSIEISSIDTTLLFYTKDSCIKYDFENRIISNPNSLGDYEQRFKPDLDSRTIEFILYLASGVHPASEIVSIYVEWEMSKLVTKTIISRLKKLASIISGFSIGYSISMNSFDQNHRKVVTKMNDTAFWTSIKIGIERSLLIKAIKTQERIPKIEKLLNAPRMSRNSKIMSDNNLKVLKSQDFESFIIRVKELEGKLNKNTDYSMSKEEFIWLVYESERLYKQLM